MNEITTKKLTIEPDKQILLNSFSICGYWPLFGN